jgi:type IV pilus assembly protein PilN
MRISINLATRPFVELRPLFAKLRIAMAALAVVAIGLAIGLHYLNVRAKAAKKQMDDLKAQTLTFETERANNERRMKQPQNSAVLERSKFLNALFEKKSFSWTSVMMDLEAVLPTGIQVTSIEPQITSEGDVNIRLRVSGDRDHAVDFVRNLERSQRFLHPRLATETAQTQEQGRVATVAQAPPGGVVFDILSGYNPLPEPPKEKKQPQKDDTDAAIKTPKPAVHKSTLPKTPANKPAGQPAVRPAQPPVPGGAR